jgi:predicted MPP superfamily phosphohydrolase
MMNVNDTVYYLDDGLWEEAEVFMFGGNEQVLLDSGGEWVLKKVSEVKLAKDMTDEDWRKLKY